jgi:Zn-dependent oligopeptidase
VKLSDFSAVEFQQRLPPATATLALTPPGAASASLPYAALVAGLRTFHATTDATAPTWDNFIEPLDDANERLARAWSLVGHLNAVVNTPALRDAYNAALPKVTQFFTEQGQDQRLHARFKALKASGAYAALTPARKRLIDNELRDFRLGGAELPEDRKTRLKVVHEELAALSARFDAVIKRV